MNPHFDPTEIDRLVDGELDPEARRDLLKRLDGSPDGWRRCALAFLEGQEFRLAARGWLAQRKRGPVGLGAWGRAERAPSGEGHGLGARSARPQAPGATRIGSPGRLAMAASLVVLAFLAGFAARGRPTAPIDRAGNVRRLLADSPPREMPGPAEPAQAPPVVTPPIDAAPPAMPEYVQAQWARAGYDVKPSRRVISVEEGGRKATFPVDSYRFEFVGRPTY